MTTVADNFNRADGPIDYIWTTSPAGFVTLGQQCRPGLTGYCTTPFGGGAYLDVSMDVLLDTAPAAAHGGFAVQCNANMSQRVRYTIAGTRPNLSLSVAREGVPPAVNIIATNFQWNGGPVATLRLVYNAGLWSAYVGGVLRGTGTDNLFQSNAYLALYTGYTTCRYDNLLASDVPPAVLDVTPEPIVQEAEPQEVTFRGTGTAWEPGTPGQPVFTVDKGTLSDQSITSATTGTATYTPPQADDSATFTDPSTGQTDVVPLSTGFQVEAGTPLSDEVVAYLEASAAQNGGDPGEIVSTNTPITPYGSGIDISTAFGRIYIWSNTLCGAPAESPPAEGVIYKLWRILNGGQEPDVDDNVLDAAMSAWADATNAYNSITNWRTGAAYTAQDILNAIGDIPPADLSAILTQLLAIRTDQLLSLQDPIDAVHSAQGSGLPTIHDVRDDLADIRADELAGLELEFDLLTTSRTFNLGSIINAIHAMQGAGLPTLNTLLNAITAVRGAAMRDLTVLYNLVNDAWDNLRGKVDAIAASLTAHDAHLTSSTDAILDAIAALPQTQVDLGPVLTAISNHDAHLTTATNSILAAIAGIRPSDYPLWPGAANATIGPPQQFSGALRLDGAMDGVLISIDVANLKQLSWQVDGTTNWKWAGYLAFLTDLGDAESHQYLGLSPAMYVPQRMLQASGVVVHLSAGVQATIRTWVYTP